VGYPAGTVTHSGGSRASQMKTRILHLPCHMATGYPAVATHSGVSTGAVLRDALSAVAAASHVPPIPDVRVGMHVVLCAVDT
jgi:hypothetical protein